MVWLHSMTSWHQVRSRYDVMASSGVTWWICMRLSIHNKKGLYNVGNAGGTWMLRHFHLTKIHCWGFPDKIGIFERPSGGRIWTKWVIFYNGPQWGILFWRENCKNPKHRVLCIDLKDISTKFGQSKLRNKNSATRKLMCYISTAVIRSGSHQILYYTVSYCDSAVV